MQLVMEHTQLISNSMSMIALKRSQQLRSSSAVLLPLGALINISSSPIYAHNLTVLPVMGQLPTNVFRVTTQTKHSTHLQGHASATSLLDITLIRLAILLTFVLVLAQICPVDSTMAITQQRVVFLVVQPMPPILLFGGSLSLRMLIMCV